MATFSGRLNFDPETTLPAPAVLAAIATVEKATSVFMVQLFGQAQ